MSGVKAKGGKTKEAAAAATLLRSVSKESYAHLNPDGVEELRCAFNMLDRNKDGQLSVPELQTMLKTFNIDVPDELVLELFHHCSHTGSGELTEIEFLEFVSTHLTDDGPPGTTEDDFRAAFRVFDKDNNGFITRDELKTAMELLGEQMTDDDIDNMIAMADLNKDGKIDYEEFTRLLS